MQIPKFQQLVKTGVHCTYNMEGDNTTLLGSLDDEIIRTLLHEGDLRENLPNPACTSQTVDHSVETGPQDTNTPQSKVTIGKVITEGNSTSAGM